MNGVETPIWAKYAGDLFFLALFLIFFFFFKPTAQSEDEWDSEEEAPNPLEQILMTENEEEENLSENEEIETLPSEKEKPSDS
ncbi:MAG: hypothetical protein KKB51_19270 [Candidatus Riflebacteria bacterium]|nr:hypothetical protein [Candidatus Riflebacteria bacterium]